MSVLVQFGVLSAFGPHQGDILHQMNDAWTDPGAMSEPVLAIGDMKGDENLGRK